MSKILASQQRSLLDARGCVVCSSVPSCPECPENYSCSLSVQSCDACPTTYCSLNAGASASSASSSAAAASSSSENTGAIAGGVVGGIAALAIAAFIFVLWRFYYSKSARARRLNEKAMDGNLTPVNPDGGAFFKSDPYSSGGPPPPFSVGPSVASPPGSARSSAKGSTRGMSRVSHGSMSSMTTADNRASNVIPIAYIPGGQNRYGGNPQDLNSQYYAHNRVSQATDDGRVRQSIASTAYRGSTAVISSAMMTAIHARPNLVSIHNNDEDEYDDDLSTIDDDAMSRNNSMRRRPSNISTTGHRGMRMQGPATPNGSGPVFYGSATQTMPSQQERAKSIRIGKGRGLQSEYIAEEGEEGGEYPHFAQSSPRPKMPSPTINEEVDTSTSTAFSSDDQDAIYCADSNAINVNHNVASANEPPFSPQESLMTAPSTPLAGAPPARYSARTSSTLSLSSPGTAQGPSAASAQPATHPQTLAAQAAPTQPSAAEAAPVHLNPPTTVPTSGSGLLLLPAKSNNSVNSDDGASNNRLSNESIVPELNSRNSNAIAPHLEFDTRLSTASFDVPFVLDGYEGDFESTSSGVSSRKPSTKSMRSAISRNPSVNSARASRVSLPRGGTVSGAATPGGQIRDSNAYVVDDLPMEAYFYAMEAGIDEGDEEHPDSVFSDSNQI